MASITPPATPAPPPPTVESLADAAVSNPGNGQLFQYNKVTGRWNNVTPQPVTVHAGSIAYGAPSADVARGVDATYFTNGGAGGSQAFDGDDSTSWGGFGEPRWIAVDLAAPATISVARLFQGIPGHRPDGVPPYGLTLQAQNGGDPDWVDIAHNVDPGPDWIPTFPSVTYQRWRALFTMNVLNSTWPAVMYTFSLYGDLGASTELLAGAEGTKLTMVGGVPTWV